MKLLYIYDGDWPRGATRVAKQTRALAREHDVTLVCRNESRDARVADEPWMAVRRLPAFGPRLLNKAINFPYFFNPVWITHLFAVARSIRAECIVVADLPLAPTALFVGRIMRLPVYYDLAEVYPEFIRSQWVFDDMDWSDHLVRNPRAAELLEQFVITRMAGLFVVSEESRNRLLAKGVEAGRVAIVGNTPDEPEAYHGTGAVPPGMEQFTGRPVLLFVGILIGDRGVATAIRAMKHLRTSHPDAVLVIVGDGPDRARLEALVEENGLSDSVAFLGWQAHETLPDYYASGDIGLLPFHDGSHIRITLANKLFDYMAAGLAVIATDLPPMRRIVDECKCGIVIPPEDPVSLAESAARMIDHPELRRAMGTAGRTAVGAKYNWTFDAERLLSAIRRA